MLDETQRIPVDVTLMGRTLEEMLQSNAKSLSNELNKHEGEKAQKKQVYTADQYFVVFPKERSSKGKLNSGGGNSQGATDAASDSEKISISANSSGNSAADEKNLDELYAQVGAMGDVNVDEEVFKKWYEEVKKLITQTALGEEIRQKQTGADASNKIGLSKMFALEKLGTNNQPFGDASFTYDKDKKVWHRANGQLQIDPGLGAIKFIQGTRIQDIIEELVILVTTVETLLMHQQKKDCVLGLKLIHKFSISRIEKQKRKQVNLREFMCLEFYHTWYMKVNLLHQTKHHMV